MATHLLHSEKNCFYFVTFTCYNWLPIIDQCNLYEYLPKWSENLSKKGCRISGYVIMPNHIHLLVFVEPSSKGLNSIIGEAKRFMSYEIIKRLKLAGKFKLLNQLSIAVTLLDAKKGQKHVVFKPSFDAKEVRGDLEINKVLDYMHFNPVSGKWQLVENYLDYKYSSASYYELGEKSNLTLIDYRTILRVFCE
ncbi:MAG: transposase [Chitinophagales bacterium]